MKQSRSQKIKEKARRTLGLKMDVKPRTYVADTSSIISEFLKGLIKKGLQGKIMIPNAVMAELENLANKGNEAGFIGLDEVANLHRLKHVHNFSLFFEGLRPTEHQIKFAKSGEIDAAIREIAMKNHATLVTADLVQAKTAQAYNIPVLFMKPKKIHHKKRKFFLFKFRKRK
jgi:ATPase